MARKTDRKRSVNARGAFSASERRRTIGKNLSFGASEAYKLLRTNLVFSMTDEEGSRVIGVTSALRGEGKSTTSINLAYSLAQTGKRVLLLEADMRIPVMASILRLEENAPGLSQVLAGMTAPKDAVRQLPHLLNVSVLPAGDIPPNPAELLASKRMEIILEALVSVFEYIIIDLPPVNAVSDGLAISRLLSGMIVVVRQDYCDQQALAEAMQRMELLEVKVLGFVLNGAESAAKRNKKYGNGGYYKQGHGYAYGYGKKEAQVAAAAESVPAPVAAQEPEPESGTMSNV